MPELGVAVVVIDGSQVLLTKRNDFDVWCLPGGAVDPNESLEQAAVREVQEETGILITLTGLVGICSRPLWSATGTHSVLFAARPKTHTFIPQPTEVTAIAYVPYHDLPTPLLWDHPTYIHAAVAGVRGQLWTSSVQLPPQLQDRAALYRWRDQLGVSRQEAYRQLLQLIGPCTLRASSSFDGGTRKG